MNRLIMITILVLVLPIWLSAQINWTEHPIDTDYAGAFSVFAIDLDGDEDVDVLGAALTADDITWWENDGEENFTEHVIADSFDGAAAVFGIDIEPDGDVDVLGAALTADDITWWENDGSENFTEHTINGNFNGARSVFGIDIDDDDDVDVLGAASNADDITWWENDGSENFTEYTINGSFDGARSVFGIDIEPDGDVDVLGAAFDADDIRWWKNDGSENFTEDTIAGSFNGAWDVFAIDLDNDGDVDVLGAAYYANEITWWENDGEENFTEHTIDGNVDGAAAVFAIDVDDDGDKDVLGIARSADDIIWWESDLATNDVSTISIDIDSLLQEGTILNPQATVKNLSASTKTFDVTCEIDPGAYTSDTSAIDLAAGDSIQVTFPNEFTFVSGSYTVTVYTQLAGDENPTNDTLEKVIETYDPGIAEDGSILPEALVFRAPTISRGSAKIEFSLSAATQVDLVVYDATGRLSQTLVSRRFDAGIHIMAVDLELPTGVYFYNLKTDVDKDIVQKFLLIE